MLSKIITFIVSVIVLVVCLKIVAWAVGFLALGAGLGGLLEFVIFALFVIWLLKWISGGFPPVSF